MYNIHIRKIVNGSLISVIVYQIEYTRLGILVLRSL